MFGIYRVFSHILRGQGRYFVKGASEHSDLNIIPRLLRGRRGVRASHRRNHAQKEKRQQRTAHKFFHALIVKGLGGVDKQARIDLAGARGTETPCGVFASEGIRQREKGSSLDGKSKAILPRVRVANTAMCANRRYRRRGSSSGVASVECLGVPKFAVLGTFSAGHAGRKTKESPAEFSACIIMDGRLSSCRVRPGMAFVGNSSNPQADDGRAHVNHWRNNGQHDFSECGAEPFGH